jgi:hypothetical protein
MADSDDNWVKLGDEAVKKLQFNPSKGVEGATANNYEER